ncbi:transmembrane protein 176 [Lampris incognitus]|uniref:transmembrane protein 176 n=1 Tax=Lampris incognitus TaxID=2546036 RepID=UPI0024B562C1|nr:transmembrane protein 176 [Lampris incognitus]
MASVSRDLSVHVHEDVNITKLNDRQQFIKKGETKSMGVSQMMLGLMVMSYSIPLHFTEFTQVVSLGVPWWSGMSFITAGAVTIFVQTNWNSKTLGLCMTVSALSALLSVVALIIYSVDLEKNPEVPCVTSQYHRCDEKHYASRLNRGVKSFLLLFTLVQTVVSSVLCFLLHRERANFGQYTNLAHSHSAIMPDGISPALD